MSLFHGPPVTIEYRAEDIKKSLRPDWPLDRCQEELMAVQTILRNKLQDVALKMLNALLCSDGTASAKHIPALCPDCIGELAVSEHRERDLVKEIAKATRVEVMVNGLPVVMHCNAYTVQRWTAGQCLDPGLHVLVFPPSHADRDGVGYTVSDLQGVARTPAGNWMLRGGQELRVRTEMRP